MERLPKDMIEKISNELNTEEFIAFCNSMNGNPTIKKIYDSNDFWYRRLQKDFNFLLEYISKKENINKNYKNIYLTFFSIISKASETLTDEVLDTFGPVKKYINNKYKKKIYRFFFYECLLDFLIIMISNYGDDINEDKTNDNIFEVPYSSIDLYLPEFMTDEFISEGGHPDFWNKLILTEVKNFMEKIAEFLNIKKYKFRSSPLHPLQFLYSSLQNPLHLKE